MLIESASTRLAIDLIKSIENNKTKVSDIRISYITDTGRLIYKSFVDLQSLISFYLNKYNKMNYSRRNPFTSDRSRAQLEPNYENGLLLSAEQEPINSSTIDGFCKLGMFISIERFNITSYATNNKISYICNDVSSDLRITQIRKNDIRRNSKIKNYTDRLEKSIRGSIMLYQTILIKLYKLYNVSLYVDLCYVEPAYVEDSMKLYSLFFAITRRDINRGLGKSVLQPMFLKKI